MSNKLIVLMVDGVSADYYQTDSGRLPNFASLEKRGFRVENLHSEVLGTSLPGRTSMLTGVTADISGVYGNKIWDHDQGEFRYANPDDVRVPTIPARAKAAGKTVANIGFGMIRPEDAHIYKAPWWSGTFIQRARDAEPQPADAAWIRAATHQTDDSFRIACEAAGVPADLAMTDLTTDVGKLMFGLMADHAMVDWAGVMATSANPPDLIITEFLLTDTVQHNTGYKSDSSHWSIMQADMALGKLLGRLRNAGVADEWNIAVMSDHGHSAIETALHPQVIIPGARVQCEGQCMLVAPRDDTEREEITRKLAEYDVEPYPNECIPPENRDAVMIFVAPDGMTFENDDAETTEPTGKPNATSSHGLRPGRPGDDRFALFAGPAVPQGCITEANAVQVAPTFAHILGLPTDDFPAELLF